MLRVSSTGNGDSHNWFLGVKCCVCCMEVWHDCFFLKKKCVFISR